MRRYQNVFLWLVIILGIVLRMTDVGFPDFSTDEAQFAMGASAAQPPWGMALFGLAQAIFGANILAARSVCVVLGIATVIVIYFIARSFLDRKTSLLVAALAAIFPTHILFSRLAYLSTPLCFAWALTLLMFLKARKTNDPKWIIGLFLASVFATFIKTQGLLLPFFLLIETIFEEWRHSAKKHFSFSIFNFQFSIFNERTLILSLSLIPIALYIVTNPGIPATLLLYGGNMYGISDFTNRISTIMSLWWRTMPLLTVLIAVSLITIRKIPWPICILIILGSTLGLFLGPAHEYYMTYLVFWALPIGMMLAKWNPGWRIITVAALAAGTLLFVGPRSILNTAWMHHLYREEGYWNIYAEEINEIFKDEEEIIVLGYPGHHIRWYLEPRVLVGRNMDIEGREGMFLLLDKEDQSRFPDAEVVYEDEEVVIVVQ